MKPNRRQLVLGVLGGLVLGPRFFASLACAGATTTVMEVVKKDGKQTVRFDIKLRKAAKKTYGD